LTPAIGFGSVDEEAEDDAGGADDAGALLGFDPEAQPARNSAAVTTAVTCRSFRAGRMALSLSSGVLVLVRL
jgi:hypothetical protein